MADEKLLTVREVAHYLNLTEKDVLDLAEDGSIPAYKVGGLYIRFKRQQVEEFKKQSRKGTKPESRNSFFGSIADFLYFNDFYIISALLIAVMLFVIFS
jgi:excisionase family DNA binding protein